MYYISNACRRLHQHIESDAWRGLPELYNDSESTIPRRVCADSIDGTYCADSCKTQAWSSSTILDVLEEMHRINKAKTEK